MYFDLKQIKWNKISTLYIFLGGFVFGIILIIFGKNEFLQTSSIFSEEALVEISLATFDEKELFVSILVKRLGSLILFMLFATTYLYMANIWLYLIWYGISFGMLFGILVLRYAIKGLGLMVVALFPHYIIYVLVILWCLELCKHKRTINTQYILQMLFMSGILLIGAFLESYVNPIFLQKYLLIL